MDNRFDYYSLLQYGAQPSQRWYAIPHQPDLGYDPQPEELFSAPWIANPVVPDAAAWQLLAEIFAALRQDDEPELYAKCRQWEQALLHPAENWDLHCILFTVNGLETSCSGGLFAEAELCLNLGRYAGAECAYRLLCLMGYPRARGKLGSLIRRGEVGLPGAYTRQETERLLQAGADSGDPIAQVELALLHVPALNSPTGDWRGTEELICALTPAGAYEAKAWWEDWDLHGLVEGPLVHFLLLLFGKIEPPSPAAFSMLCQQVRCHFPSIDAVLNDRRKFRFWDRDGKQWKVLFFRREWGNEYVVYTDKSCRQNGSLNLWAGRTHPVEGWRGMCPLNMDEQEMIRKTLDNLHKTARERQKAQQDDKK